MTVKKQELIYERLAITTLRKVKRKNKGKRGKKSIKEL